MIQAGVEEKCLDSFLERGEEALAKAMARLAQREERVAELEWRLQSAEAERNVAKETLAAILKSRSWRITAPMRLAARLIRWQRPFVSGGLRARMLDYAKPIYWKIPHNYRRQILLLGYRGLPWLFAGTPHFELWKNGSGLAESGEAGSDHLVEIDAVPAAQRAKGSIAIHLHLFYEDLAGEFAGYLRNMPFEYDLYVSVKDGHGDAVCRNEFSGLPKLARLVVEVVPNRGRDIAPMFCTFAEHLRRYDYIGHLHGKKSLHNQGATDGWRQYLCGGLLGGDERIRRIISLLQDDAAHGIVYPQNFHLLPYWANTWLANRSMGAQWCARLGVANMPTGYFDFPAGSMFWARGDALKALFQADITFEDFSEESGQTDGTLAHCLERLLVLSARRQGLRAAIIKDQQVPSWSPWRLGQCTGRSIECFRVQVHAGEVKLIGFDIFDTLLCRALMNPDSTKDIVARRVGGEVARLYMQYRGPAETIAREEAGRDIDLDAIYRKLGAIAGLPDEAVTRLRAHEEAVERESLVPRSGGLELYREALASGKPVVLLSDMFLPRTQIERILGDHGVAGWAGLYVSSDVGLRKDTGALYDFVLARHGVGARELLMVGDNERSDIQIPGDRGASLFPVLKAVEMGRGAPRMQPLVEEVERYGNLDDQMTLGLVLRENFSAVFYPGFDPSSLVPPTPFHVGYSVMGPLLTSFADWLLEKTRRDGIARMYFLAREGEVLKKVFDIWTRDLPDVPDRHYLVVSRRAVSVPALTDHEGILQVARATYFPKPIEDFLEERYGLMLGAGRWTELAARTAWRPGKVVEVRQGNIDHLAALLELLQGEILSVGSAERMALERYLEDQGLLLDGRQAVVDVGYGGTIQGYLNSLIARPVHGYYLITDERIVPIENRYGIIAAGCFGDRVPCDPRAPLMYRRSFDLEKMLSASSAQVVRYVLDDELGVRGVFRELSSGERIGRTFRAELQAGIVRYAEDAVRVRTSLLPDFRPSTDVARKLYDQLFQQQSVGEIELFKRVVLDDHYCGRGLVC